MEQKLLELGFFKDINGGWFSVGRNQMFFVDLDKSALPPCASIKVPWGEKNNRQLFCLVAQVSSPDKLESVVCAYDVPPGELHAVNLGFYSIVKTSACEGSKPQPKYISI